METHEQFPVFVIDDGARSFVRLEFCLLNFPMGDLMSHTPWTQEQAEKWCIPDDHPRFLDITDIDGRMLYRAAYVDGFRFAISKAAEMIEACPTLYGETTIAQYGREVPTGNWTETRVDTYDTHSAKLVGVRPIEGSEK